MTNINKFYNLEKNLAHYDGRDSKYEKFTWVNFSYYQGEGVIYLQSPRYEKAVDKDGLPIWRDPELLWSRKRPKYDFPHLESHDGTDPSYGFRHEADVVVAEVNRWHDVTVHRPDLMKECPFREFTDGLFFHHPTEGWKSYNEGATPIVA